VKQQEPEMQTETVAPPASQEVQAVKPVAPKVVTAKARKISWAVNLTSVSTLASAEKIQQGLKNRGITSEVKQATIGGKSYYRIRIGGFGSKQEAEQVRLPLLKEREFSSAWLERYREEAQLAE
jgi:cell division protein FtsN